MSNHTRAKDVQGVPANGGRFATPINPTADGVTLSARDVPAGPPPIMVSVNLERWEGDDAVPFETVEFDATAILNTYTEAELADLEDHSSDGDDIYHEAVRQVLVKDHDGPFEVSVRGPLDAALEADPERFAAKNRQIDLAAGDGEDYSELADGDVIRHIAIARSEDGETVTVEASQELNLVELAPADLNYGEKLEWLIHNDDATAEFFKERYGADLIDRDEGYEAIEVHCATDVPFEGLTPAGIADAAWGTGITKVHNEYDNGTYGSENMDRLLRGACTEPPVFPAPTDAEVFIRSDQVGVERLSAQKLKAPTRVPGFKREWNRYTGEFTVTTPHGDHWTYKKKAA